MKKMVENMLWIGFIRCLMWCSWCDLVMIVLIRKVFRVMLYCSFIISRQKLNSMFSMVISSILLFLKWVMKFSRCGIVRILIIREIVMNSISLFIVVKILVEFIELLVVIFESSVIMLMVRMFLMIRMLKMICVNFLFFILSLFKVLMMMVVEDMVSIVLRKMVFMCFQLKQRLILQLIQIISRILVVVVMKVVVLILVSFFRLNFSFSENSRKIILSFDRMCMVFLFWIRLQGGVCGLMIMLVMMQFSIIGCFSLLKMMVIMLVMSMMMVMFWMNNLILCIVWDFFFVFCSVLQEWLDGFVEFVVLGKVVFCGMGCGWWMIGIVGVVGGLVIWVWCWVLICVCFCC